MWDSRFLVVGYARDHSNGEICQGQVIHVLQGQAGRIEKAINPILKRIAV